MEYYQATPFSGEWDELEDPKLFLEWFLECTGTMDDETKAHHFIYYLQADSNAEEWFEDLLEEEKGSWVRIERLFREEWLKGEGISIKESVTSKNTPEPASTHLTLPSATSSVPTKSQTSPTTLVTMSQSPVLFGNGGNAKVGITSKILLYNADFSLSTPSFSSLNSSAPSTISPAHEMLMSRVTPCPLKIKFYYRFQGI